MYKNYILKVTKEGLYEGLAYEGKPPKVKRYDYISHLTFNELKGKRVYLLLKTSRFLFENYHIQLPIYSPDILRLKLQDRVNSLGYFGKAVNIYWKVLEQKDNYYKISYLALERDFVEEEIKKLKEVAGAIVEGVTFLPLALAGIIPREPGDKIVIHREPEGLWILIMTNGNIHLIEFLPIDEFLGLNLDELKTRIAFLQNLYYRDTQRTLNILYSTNNELLEELRDIELQKVLIEKDFPEYFGIFKLESEFNFLPEEEKAIKVVLESNYKISIVLLILSFIFAISAVTLRWINGNLQREILLKETLINESLQRLFAQYPEEKLRAYRGYLEEREKLRKNPNPEVLLIRLIQGLEGTKISQLEVKREGESYSFVLKGEKTLSPQELNSFSEQLIKALSTFSQIRDRKIDYSSRDNKIFFEINGIFQTL